MKKITVKWLKKHKACCSEEDMIRAEKEFSGDIFKIIPAFIENNRLDDANWLITQYMNKKQCVMYFVYVAELVLPIFKKRYPGNDKPILAIEAAKDYVKRPCKRTKAKAAEAAADAADNGAYHAANAAYHAAGVTCCAAYIAYRATRAAYADNAYATKRKIINYGLSLIEGQRNIK